MSWFKLDDQFHSQPKVIAAGNAAIGLYCRLGTYCADKLTDGFVPTSVARSFMGTSKELRALTTCPIPDTRPLLDEVPGGYLMRDYLDYNPSRAAVLAERDKAKDRMARGRARSADVRANNRANVGRSSVGPDPVPLVNTSENNDDYSHTRPSSSSSFDEQIAWRWEIAVLVSERSKTRRQSVQSYATGVLTRIANERARDLDAWYLEGLTPVQVADIVEPAEPQISPNHPSNLPPDTRSAETFGRSCAAAELGRGDKLDLDAFRAEVADKPEWWQDAAVDAYLAGHLADSPLASNVIPFRSETTA